MFETFDSSPCRLLSRNQSKISHFFERKFEKQLKTIRNFCFHRRLHQIYDYESSLNSSIIELDMESFEIFENFCSNLKENKSLLVLDCTGISMSTLMIIRLMQTLEFQTSLKNLIFANTNISSLALKYICRTLKQNKSIEILNLFNINILNENLRDLSELILVNCSIKEINLNFCDMDSETIKDLCEILIQNSRLSSIKLAKQDFSDKSFRALAYFLGKIPKPKLKILDLSYNKIGEIELEIIITFLPKFQSWAKSFRNLPSINFLNLTSNKINTIKACEFLTYWVVRINNLTKLSLSKNFLSGDMLVLLEKCILNVKEEIDLSRNCLQMGFPTNINFFSNLKYINLNHNNLNGFSIHVISNALKDNFLWENIDLSYNDIDDKDLEKLCFGLSENNNLKILGLANNKIQKIEIFSYYSGKIKIKELDISFNPIKENSLEVFFKEFQPNFLIKLKIEGISSKEFTNIKIHQSFFQTIETLSLVKSSGIILPILNTLSYGNYIVDLDLSNSFLLSNTIIEKLGLIFINSKSLRNLSLKSLNLGGLPEIYLDRLLSKLSKNKTIEKLIISRNQLGRYCSMVLTYLKLMNNLKVLDLSYNVIENELSDYLDHFFEEVPLIELDLSNNPIGYTVIDKLYELLKENQSLKTLKLSNTLLNIDCLMPLGNLLLYNNTIEILDISGNNIHKKNMINMITNKIKMKKKKFVYSGNKIDNYQFSLFLSYLVDNKALNHLDISKSDISHKNILRLIKYISQVQNLNFLNISGTHLFDSEIAELFKRLYYHKEINEILLRNLEIKGESIYELKNFLKKTETLKLIDISENKLSKNFFYLINEELKNNNSIEAIIIEECFLDSYQILPLLEIIASNKKIIEIYLESNKIIFSDLIILLNLLAQNKKKLKILDLSKNPIFENEIESNSQLGHLLIQLNVVELELSSTFKDFHIDFVKELSFGLSHNPYIIKIYLNNNKLNDQHIIFLKEIIEKNNTLEEIHLQNNEFTVYGFQYLFQALENNRNLSFIDISSNLKNNKYESLFCQNLETTFLKNKFLKLMDISNNFLFLNYNKHFCKIFEENKQIFFINKHWEGLQNATAIHIITRLIFIYDNLKVVKNKIIPPVITNLNFSKGKLNDDFCVFFSKNMKDLKYLESFDFSYNNNITLVGLKFMYVSLVHYQNFLKIKFFYFRTYNHLSILNEGLASTIVEWARYGSNSSKINNFFKKFCNYFFSKLIIRANRFQYGSNFQQFYKKFDIRIVILFYFINYIAGILLSILLPVFWSMSCSEGINWYAHILYSCFLCFTFIIEFNFWLKVKTNLVKSSINERDLQKQLFINDIINLVAGVLARADSYLDVCFIMAAKECNDKKIRIMAIVIIIIKFGIKSRMFISCYFKLIKAYRTKNDLRALNMISKLAIIMDYLLIGDILDRYCPGNGKKIKRILLRKLKIPIYINIIFVVAVIKLFLEDIPQSILQICFITVRSEAHFYYNENNEQIMQEANKYIIYIKIANSLLGILLSILTVVTLRPSFLEQSDFDERVEVLNLLNTEVENVTKSPRTSILKEKIEKTFDSNKKIIQLRESLDDMRKSTFFKGKQEIWKPEDDFLNIEIDSIPSHDFNEEKNKIINDIERIVPKNKEKIKNILDDSNRSFI